MAREKKHDQAIVIGWYYDENGQFSGAQFEDKGRNYCFTRSDRRIEERLERMGYSYSEKHSALEWNDLGCVDVAVFIRPKAEGGATGKRPTLHYANT